MVWFVAHEIKVWNLKLDSWSQGFIMIVRMNTILSGKQDDQRHPSGGAVWPMPIPGLSIRKSILRVLIITVLIGLGLGASPLTAAVRHLPAGKKQLIIDLQRGGHLLFVEVMINGKEAGVFVLDTGAGHTVVDTKVADRLKLLEIGKATVRGTGGSTKGTVRKVRSLRIGEFESGAHILASADLSSWTDTLGVDIAGLLGADVFSALPFSLDYSKQTITFFAREQFKAPANAKAMKLILLDRRPAIKVRIDQEFSGLLLLDTGVQGMLQFDRDYLANNKALRPEIILGDVESVGIAGAEQMIRGRIKTLEILGRKLVNVQAHFPTIKAGPTPKPGQVSGQMPTRMGLAGGRLLRDFFLTFDYRSKQMWVLWQPDNPLAGRNSEQIDLNKQDFLGRTLLNDSVLEGKLALVKALLAAGANARTIDKKGRSAMFDAVRAGRVELIELLIDAGTEVNDQDKDGETALMLAAQNGQQRVVEKLIEFGADRSIQSEEGMFALYLAAAHNRQAVVEHLLSGEVRVDDSGPDEATALMVAADRGHESVVRALIKAGAKLDRRDSGGYTALMFAAQHGHKLVVKALLDGGAEVAIKNSEGQTAMSLARLGRQAAVVHLLIAAGGK
jgi:ankyrin repeat protein/predicted aspartyl protease